MTALIITVVWDTVENGRTPYTRKTLISLLHTVDFNKHRLFISDNGSCLATQNLYADLKRWFRKFPKENLTIHFNGSNIGCSNAINQGLLTRRPGEAALKLDPDVVFADNGWIDKLAEVIERCPEYGIVACKRKDLDNHPDQDQPDHNNPMFQTMLRQLPHRKGQTHITVEEAPDIIGTCTLFSPLLIDAIGMSAQPGLYGFEDNLYSLRSRLAGFKNCFLPHLVIDHIDTGENSYTQDKQQWAHRDWAMYAQMHSDYLSGARPLYENGGFVG